MRNPTYLNQAKKNKMNRTSLNELKKTARTEMGDAKRAIHGVVKQGLKGLASYRKKIKGFRRRIEYIENYMEAKRGSVGANLTDSAVSDNHAHSES